MANILSGRCPISAVFTWREDVASVDCRLRQLLENSWPSGLFLATRVWICRRSRLRGLQCGLMSNRLFARIAAASTLFTIGRNKRESQDLVVLRERFHPAHSRHSPGQGSRAVV